MRTETVFKGQALSVEICDRSKVVSVLVRMSCAYIRMLGRRAVTTTKSVGCGELESCPYDRKFDTGSRTPRH